MKEINTEIEINAPPEKVWRVITDFTHFPDWNPFIREIVGTLIVGSKLEIHISTTSGKNRTYRTTLTKVEPNHELRWYGKGLLPGLLNGEHIIKIEQLSENHVRMIHQEIFTGIGTFLAGNRMEKDVRHSFEEMNSALKKKIEHDER
ncbi:MAG TPA: SRPBCC domain-containing protein [Candidatus Eisenbacteria bacterium]|nr:SRPBCC domain-containing protein [Candidatus Eisenbacteria bacterium]